jgi:hypothetical protein
MVSLKIVRFLVLLFSFASYPLFAAETKIGVRAKIIPPYTNELNMIYGNQELGLIPRPDYHVGIGMIEGVPKSKVKGLIQELRIFLMSVHDIISSPIGFEIKMSTTFHRMNSNNYADESFILLPVETDMMTIMEINRRLNEFIVKKSKEYPIYQKMRLDRPTSPERYIPHITVLTPKDDRKRIVDSAINETQINPNKYQINIFLNDYSISEKVK